MNGRSLTNHLLTPSLNIRTSELADFHHYALDHLHLDLVFSTAVCLFCAALDSREGLESQKLLYQATLADM
jgi:hypothetical protein